MDRSRRLPLDARRSAVREQPRRCGSVRLAIPLVAALALAACGDRDAGDAASDLSPAAAAGRAVYLDRGCAACHGDDGRGRVGPSLAGIVGTEVAIEGGGSVPVDREYLVESIVEPSAKIVEGYGLPMPRVDLTDDEVASIVGYLEALTAPGAGT